MAAELLDMAAPQASPNVSLEADVSAADVVMTEVLVAVAVAACWAAVARHQVRAADEEVQRPAA